MLALRGGQLRVHASCPAPDRLGCRADDGPPDRRLPGEARIDDARTWLWVCRGALCAIGFGDDGLAHDGADGPRHGRRRAATARRRDRSLLAGAPDPPDRDPLRRARRARWAHKSFFPEEGLIGDVQGRAGRAAPAASPTSGRASGSGPRSRSSATGPGARSTFEREETHLGPAPIAAVIFDNQYMSTLVQLGLLGLIGGVPARLGEHAAADSRRARQHRPAERPDHGLRRGLRRASGWRCSSSMPSRSRSARSCSSSSPHWGCARRTAGATANTGRKSYDARLEL